MAAPFHPYPSRSRLPGRDSAVSFLWHFPYRRRTALASIPLRPSPLASTLPCGVRTFLSPTPASRLRYPCGQEPALRRSSDRPACSRESNHSVLDGRGQTARQRGTALICGVAPGFSPACAALKGATLKIGQYRQRTATVTSGVLVAAGPGDTGGCSGGVLSRRCRTNAYKEKLTQRTYILP